jgi:hypothetical protein
MKKLRGLFFGKKVSAQTEDTRIEYGDIGIIFAPGPDKGLYVKGVVKDSPVWDENCRNNLESLGPKFANDGSEGAIRIGDCLLDIQEIFDRTSTDKKKARGKKFDVFAKPQEKVSSVLKKIESPVVELSFRRIAPSGDSVLITVMLERRRMTDDQHIEAKQAISEIQQRQERARMTEVDMRFAEIDEDGSGSVTLEELLQFLQVLHLLIALSEAVGGRRIIHTPETNWKAIALC